MISQIKNNFQVYRKWCSMTNFIWNWDETTEWLFLKDAFLASKLASKPAKILEFGVWKGGWIFTFLANSPESIAVGVDPYPDLARIRSQFLDTAENLGFLERIKLFSAFSEMRESASEALIFDLIHVDGEHTEDATFQDLNNAKSILSPDGIIIADDLFYSDYPGVASAIFRFIHESDFSPFCVTSKKIYMCHSSNYDAYYAKTRNILIENQIPFLEDDNLTKNSNISYKQSNSVKGFPLLVVVNSISNNKEFLRASGVRNEPMTVKKILKLWLPPIFIQIAQRLRRLVNFLT